MKAALYTLAFVIGMGGLLKAQDYGEDSATCRENLYIYYELAKRKNTSKPMSLGRKFTICVLVRARTISFMDLIS